MTFKFKPGRSMPSPSTPSRAASSADESADSPEPREGEIFCAFRDCKKPILEGEPWTVLTPKHIVHKACLSIIADRVFGNGT